MKKKRWIRALSERLLQTLSKIIVKTFTKIFEKQISHLKEYFQYIIRQIFRKNVLDFIFKTLWKSCNISPIHHRTLLSFWGPKFSDWVILLQSLPTESRSLWSSKNWVLNNFFLSTRVRFPSPLKKSCLIVGFNQNSFTPCLHYIFILIIVLHDPNWNKIYWLFKLTYIFFTSFLLEGVTTLWIQLQVSKKRQTIRGFQSVIGASSVFSVGLFLLYRV